MKQVWSLWAVTAIAGIAVAHSEKDYGRPNTALHHNLSPMKVRKIVSPTIVCFGKTHVTRAECAAFVRETGHPPVDEYGKDSFKWNKQLVVVSRVASSISHEKKKPR